jgi:hypothetical protein
VPAAASHFQYSNAEHAHTASAAADLTTRTLLLLLGRCVNLWNVVGHYAAELRHLPVLQSSQQRASNMQRRQQGLFDNQERKALL